MLKAICAKCGTSFYGWSLASPSHQTCSHCGGLLEIIENWREGALSKRTSTIDGKKSGEGPGANRPATEDSTKVIPTNNLIFTLLFLKKR